MKYYTIGEFAKLIGKAQQTLRNWDKSGKLKPSLHVQKGNNQGAQKK
ncbi:MerR family DNA-binding transcriptional regulator [Caminicella sporogenes]